MKGGHENQEQDDAEPEAQQGAVALAGLECPEGAEPLDEGVEITTRIDDVNMDNYVVDQDASLAENDQVLNSAAVTGFEEAAAAAAADDGGGGGDDTNLPSANSAPNAGESATGESGVVDDGAAATADGADDDEDDDDSKLPATTGHHTIPDETLQHIAENGALPPNAADDDDNRKTTQDETLEHVSDISSSGSSEASSFVAVDNKNTAPTSSTSAHLPRNRSFTICSVITNTSEHGSIRSQRENVDRLLMSGGGSRGGPGSSAGGSDISPHGTRGLERPNFAHTYDQNYYKRGDWLRIVPRRTSVDTFGSMQHRGASASSSEDRSSMGGSLPNGYVHGGSSPGFGGSVGNNINPDQYYRGFDNTRIRTGFTSSSINPMSRRRNTFGVTQSGQLPGHHDGHHQPHQVDASMNNMYPQQQHHHQNNGNMVGPDGQLLGTTPSTSDANLSVEQSMVEAAATGGGYLPYTPAPSSHYPHQMYPNLITGPIDEEEGGGEKGVAENLDISRKGSCSPPLEILCDLNEDNEDAQLDQMYTYAADEAKPDHLDPRQQNFHASRNSPSINGQTAVPQSRRGTPSPMPSGATPSPMPSTEAGMHFESSLRVGGFVPPSRTNTPSYPNSSITQHQVLSAAMQERNMHEASWDSKFERYACRVDQSQEDRSVEIPIFSMARPHMRGFHYAWMTFFFAFLAWFAITPLLAEVQKSLELTKAQIWTSNIASVAGAVVTRCMAGLFCDVYGARWMSAAVLLICGVPTMLTGLVNSVEGLSVLRLVTGIGGSAFVTCQYWTTTMFTKEVAGTANALAAGWGNLGGAIAQIFVGSMLFPLFKWIYGAAGTERDPADLSWRTACVIPGLMCTVFTFFVLRYADDSPKGNYRKRKREGLMEKPNAMKYIKAAIHDHNTWILLIQYGCCFGVELTTSNAAALYFKEEFELSTEAAAAVASTFGWMNLFARGLGGFLSDISNAYRGMRGRLTWQFICFLLEGVFVIVFSKARTLGGAITALMTFSLFVQGAEGSTFGIVPYLNPNVTGTVAGIVGAGGNAGAVIFSILFRQMEYRDAFFWMGATTAVISLLSVFVWIKGYEGLFINTRVIPTPEQSQETAPSGNDNINRPHNTSESQAGAESKQNHSDSYIETDPQSQPSGPLPR